MRTDGIPPNELLQSARNADPAERIQDRDALSVCYDVARDLDRWPPASQAGGWGSDGGQRSQRAALLRVFGRQVDGRYHTGRRYNWDDGRGSSLAGYRGPTDQRSTACNRNTSSGRQRPFGMVGDDRRPQ